MYNQKNEAIMYIDNDDFSVWMQKLYAKLDKIVFHIHDEVVIEIEKEKADLEEVCRLMSEPIPFAPGLPMAADGWVGEYFKKE